MGQFAQSDNHFDAPDDLRTNQNDRRTNRLLTLLSDADYDQLRRHLSKADLKYRQSLYEADVSIESVYFPVDGVASLVNTMADGSAAEVGTIVQRGDGGITGSFGRSAGAY